MGRTVVSLTGRQRVRAHTPLFGKSVLVLQLEEKFERQERYWGDGAYGYKTWKLETRWRDAQATDLPLTGEINAS